MSAAIEQRNQEATAYVGNLDENVATDQLYAFFYSYDIINIGSFLFRKLVFDHRRSIRKISWDSGVII